MQFGCWASSQQLDSVRRMWMNLFTDVTSNISVESSLGTGILGKALTATCLHYVMLHNRQSAMIIVTVSQRAWHQGRETDTAKWNSDDINSG